MVTNHTQHAGGACVDSCERQHCSPYLLLLVHVRCVLHATCTCQQLHCPGGHHGAWTIMGEGWYQSGSQQTWLEAAGAHLTRLQCTLAGITAEGRRPHCTAQHSAAPHSSWPCQQQGLMRPTTPKGRQKMQAQQARQSFAWEQLHGLCANTNHGIWCMQSPGTPRQKPHPR